MHHDRFLLCVQTYNVQFRYIYYAQRVYVTLNGSIVQSFMCTASFPAHIFMHIKAPTTFSRNENENKKNKVNGNANINVFISLKWEKNLLLFFYARWSQIESVWWERTSTKMMVRKIPFKCKTKKKLYFIFAFQVNEANGTHTYKQTNKRNSIYTVK